MNFKNKFTRRKKCDCCSKIKLVTYECEDCYFSGYDIDEQIKRLQEIKKCAKEQQNADGEKGNE